MGETADVSLLPDGDQKLEPSRRKSCPPIISFSYDAPCHKKSDLPLSKLRAWLIAEEIWKIKRRKQLIKVKNIGRICCVLGSRGKEVKKLL